MDERIDVSEYEGRDGTFWSASWKLTFGPPIGAPQGTGASSNEAIADLLHRTASENPGWEPRRLDDALDTERCEKCGLPVEDGAPCHECDPHEYESWACVED
jgi:hypothetical protein